MKKTPLCTTSVKNVRITTVKSDEQERARARSCSSPEVVLFRLTFARFRLRLLGRFHSSFDVRRRAVFGIFPNDLNRRFVHRRSRGRRRTRRFALKEIEMHRFFSFSSINEFTRSSSKGSVFPERETKEKPSGRGEMASDYVSCRSVATVIWFVRALSKRRLKQRD